MMLLFVLVVVCCFVVCCFVIVVDRGFAIVPQWGLLHTRDVHGLDSSMDWIGLDWIGSNSGKCCVDWIALGPMTVRLCTKL